MKVKICGITNLEDALLAVEYQADAIGFILHAESPRTISLNDAVKISKKLPPNITSVALVANAPKETVQQVIDSQCFNLIQFHGDESAEFCQQFNFPFIRCLRVKPAESITEQSANYIHASNIQGFLIDKWHSNAYGGQGELVEHEELDRIQLPHPLILAGGLNPKNIISRIKLIMPDAVDVSSGVESETGKKCPKKLALFISLAQKALLNKLI